MAGLVEQLQRDAIERGVSVSDLLRKAATVSSKLGVEEVDDWIRRERSGYDDVKHLPDYRRLKGELKVRNPYHGLQPLFIEDQELLELATRADVGQPISEIEHIVQSDGTIHFPLPPKFVASLMQAMNVPLEPLLVVQRASMVGILEGVRNSVLDWALALERKCVVGTGMSFSAPEKAAAAQVTYSITNNIGVMANSQLQQHSNGSTQSIAQGFDVVALAALVDAITARIGEAKLSADARAELLAELSTLRAQSSSSKPKAGIIRESLESVRRIIEGAAGNVLATFGPQIAALLAYL